MSKYIIKKEYSRELMSIRYYAYLIDNGFERFVSNTSSDTMEDCEVALKKELDILKIEPEIVKELEL